MYIHTVYTQTACKTHVAAGLGEDQWRFVLHQTERASVATGWGGVHPVKIKCYWKYTSIPRDICYFLLDFLPIKIQ